MAQYQSGHNGAVLKTVVAFIRPVGSNPTCAAMPPAWHLYAEHFASLMRGVYK